MGKLKDSLTSISVSGITVQTNINSVCTVNPYVKFFKLVRNFVTLSHNLPSSDAVLHHTVFVKTGRLSLDK